MGIRSASRLAALVILLAPVAASAQGIEYVKAHYTKYEYRIAMRDGVKLFTCVYVPKEASASVRYPILLLRTPYSIGPYGADQYKKDVGPSEAAAREGFIFAYQDVRGRYKSEGEFVDVRPHNPRKGPKEIDESSDTYDTIEFLLKTVRDNNGKVGMWGISYPGFYVAAGMIDAHPALKAASPQAPIADWFMGDDFHHNGAFYLPHAFNFYSGFGVARKKLTTKHEKGIEHGTPDGYRYFLSLPPLAEANDKIFERKVAFWDELTKHDTYDDFWKARNLRPHLREIKPAVMTVGGWFDAEDLFGALNVYKSVETQSAPTASNMLVMGPWPHGGWARGDGDALGAVKFNDKTSKYYQEKIELAFFTFHLKGKGDAKLPEAYVFETGTNQWRQLDSWPPKGAKPRTLYLAAGGRLSFDAPKDDAAFDEYVSDPAKPVPFIGDIAIGMPKEHMVADQRFASTRPDVLVYETDTLEEDVTIAGPVSPTLHVSTTGTDSDFVVKLIDVYPDDYADPDPNPTNLRMGGYQQLVRGEAFRGKFRNSFEKPEPFEPGKPARIDYQMPDAFHTFRTGHRIMVQIQSSWFPLVDRNPQTFTNIFAAKATDYRKATQRVYRSKGMATSIKLNVLN